MFEQLKDNLIQGTWKPGEKLASENELASLFGVSRITIRQALSRLAALGLVETRLGEGSFVAEQSPGCICRASFQRYFCRKKTPGRKNKWEGYLTEEVFQEVVKTNAKISNSQAALSQDIDEQNKEYAKKQGSKVLRI